MAINFKIIIIIIIHFQLVRFIVNPSLHIVVNVNIKVIIPQIQKSTYTLIMTFISLIVFSPGFIPCDILLQIFSLGILLSMA